jgi:hypothetical protein
MAGSSCEAEAQQQDFVRVETGEDGRRYIVARASAASQSSERFNQMIVAEERAKGAILRFMNGIPEDAREYSISGTLSGVETQSACYDDSHHRVYVRLRMPAPPL